ncbi:hypothetical protein TNCV_932231 [Trichonephila clavipes]|nr:hypothetical protein TNCV_932231 [Trichonephila clavipes]
MQLNSRLQSVEACPAEAHQEQFSCPRQEVSECPNLWHLKQRERFGMCGRILQLKYPALIVVSSIKLLKARKTTSICLASTHHGVQQGRQCSGLLEKPRHGAYLEYTQKIVLQHHGEERASPVALICSTNPTAVSLRRHLREVSSSDGQERAHSYHPSTVKRGPKGTQRIPKTLFSSLRDAEYGKHAGWCGSTNDVS